MVSSNTNSMAMKSTRVKTELTMEHLILDSLYPIELIEDLNPVIEINGEKGIWINKKEETQWKSDIPIEQYPINQDPMPELVSKSSCQKLVYDQEIAIRYLRPTTPLASGEIIICEDPPVQAQPAPPIVIRQQPPRPITPQPLVIREKPPTPPPIESPKVITISSKCLPPPPRKVVIERLPPLPPKPQSILIERWLPYTRPKRRVVFQRSSSELSVLVKPKNVIVQWNSPQVLVKKDIRDLGVIKADPEDYKKKFCQDLTPAEQLPEFVKALPSPSGLTLAAECKRSTRSSLPELYGDIEALNLLDESVLEKAGLSEYKSYLMRNSHDYKSIHSKIESLAESTNRMDKRSSEPVERVISNVFEKISINEITEFSQYMCQKSQVTMPEIKHLFKQLNKTHNKSYTDSDACDFFYSLDSDCDGFIDFKDLTLAISNLF